MKTKNAVVLWTGGKDSCLALHEARLAGYTIISLITLVPPNPHFLAHPLGFIQLQAEALQIPHFTIEVTEPYKENYIKAFRELKEKYFVDTLVTGDIDEVAGHPNMVKECADITGLATFFPLWKQDRKVLINEFLERQVQWIFSLVKQPHLTSEWVGRKFDRAVYAELLSREGQVDICGENGEYHSLVLDSPLFTKKIHVSEFSTKEKDSMFYLHIEKASLEDK